MGSEFILGIFEAIEGDTQTSSIRIVKELSFVLPMKELREELNKIVESEDPLDNSFYCLGIQLLDYADCDKAFEVKFEVLVK